MKNIKKIGGLLLASMLATGCYNEPLSEYSSLQDFAYLLGASNNNVSPTVMLQGEQMSFLGMAQGTLSKTWTIPEDSGILFLGDDIIYQEDDPDTTTDESTKFDYDAMVVDHAYTFTDDKKAFHLYFTEAGYFAINYRCTYSRPITYTMYDVILEKEVTYSAVYEDGVYVIDKDIEFFVASEALVPNITVKYNGVELELGSDDEDADPNDYPSITLKYGESLSFSDEFDTYDLVDVRSWTCGNPVLSNTATAPTLSFRPVGLIEPGVDTCKMYYEATRWQGSYFSSEMTSGSYRIPLNIFIEASESNVTASAAYYSNTTTTYKNKNLRVTLSTAQFDEESLLVYDPEDFIVSYTNADANMSGTIPVDTVYYVGTASRHIINVMLDEEVYTTDAVTIKYVGDDIKVLYNDTTTDFTLDETTVSMNAVESFTYDFEDVDNVDNWEIIIADDLSVYYEWPGEHTRPTLETENGNNYLSITPDEQTYAEYSIYFVNTDTFTGKMGNNTFTGKIRVSENYGADLNVYFPTDITKSTTINNTGFAGTVQISLSDTTTYPDGEWVEFTNTFTKASSITGYLNIEIGNTQRGTIDFDDLHLTNIEARPVE